jgi:hypothetical protein
LNFLQNAFSAIHRIRNARCKGWSEWWMDKILPAVSREVDEISKHREHSSSFPES